MKIENWENALSEAKRIHEELKDINIPVTTVDKEFNKIEDYNCKVIQVNPFKSFEMDSDFEFYIILEDKEKSFEHAFPYEKILRWKHKTNAQQ